MKKLLNVIFVIIVLFACKKENSDNQTNGKTTPVFNPNVSYGTMTDQDSNVYKTVTIGTQTWMAENLRTTKYRDGSAIPNIICNTAWTKLTTGAYCSYNNTKSADSIAIYGRLYNWYAATDSRNIAPTGWHVPTDAEWITLTTYLGGESVAGGKMKEAGTTHWLSPNTDATNECGFTATPGGGRILQPGVFDALGDGGSYWSSTQYDFDSAQLRSLSNSSAGCGYGYYFKQLGTAVRLIKD